MNAVADTMQPFARILEVSEEEYHRDPCTVPSLSQSIAHVLVSQSPLHAWAKHPKLGKLANADDDEDESDTEKEKAAVVAGKIIHKLLLGKGAAIDVIEADSFRSNAAKAARDQAKAAGRIPIIAHKYQALVDAAEFIREQLHAKGYSLDGESEVAFEWREQGEDGDVICRGRMDHVHLDRAQILDVKKIRSANPRTITRHIYEYGYDIQDAAYKRCLSAYLGGVEVDLVFLFMEEKPPYAITPVRLAPAFIEIGRQRWERAIFAWEMCLATSRWPDYVPDGGVLDIEPEAWVMNREIGSEW